MTHKYSDVVIANNVFIIYLLRIFSQLFFLYTGARESLRVPEYKKISPPKKISEVRSHLGSHFLQVTCHLEKNISPRKKISEVRCHLGLGL